MKPLEVVSAILRHFSLTVATLAVAASIVMACFGVGKALELWTGAGWQMVSWGAAMLGPLTAQKIADRIGGPKAPTP